MLKPENIRGLFTALITPFKDGGVDARAFEELVEWQISQGVHGLVPCGTTGESPTLSHEEHKQVVEICIKVAAGRVPVMAGAGSNSTVEAIEFTRHAEKVGAALTLQVSPYYNKPTQEGLYQHFKAIHDASGIPMIIYNIPGRSVVNITDDTLARLAELPRVAGIKDATGDLARVSTLRAKVGDRLALLSGEDMTTVGFNAMGGQGLISVTSNITPRQCADIQNACLASDYKKALQIHETLVPLHTALFAETNPIPVKFAAKLIGKCNGEIRLPLVAPSRAVQEQLASLLEHLRAAA